MLLIMNLLYLVHHIIVIFLHIDLLTLYVFLYSNFDIHRLFYVNYIHLQNHGLIMLFNDLMIIRLKTNLLKIYISYGMVYLNIGLFIINLYLFLTVNLITQDQLIMLRFLSIIIMSLNLFLMLFLISYVMLFITTMDVIEVGNL